MQYDSWKGSTLHICPVVCLCGCNQIYRKINSGQIDNEFVYMIPNLFSTLVTTIHVFYELQSLLLIKICHPSWYHHTILFDITNKWKRQTTTTIQMLSQFPYQLYCVYHYLIYVSVLWLVIIYIDNNNQYLLKIYTVTIFPKRLIVVWIWIITVTNQCVPLPIIQQIQPFHWYK